MFRDIQEVRRALLGGDGVFGEKVDTEMNSHDRNNRQQLPDWLQSLSHSDNVKSMISARLNPRYISNTLVSMTKSFAYALVPQLIRTIYFNDPEPVAKINSTSWMNGLRGIASFFVFNEHYIYNFTYTLLVGYGTRPKDTWIHQLPVFELFNDGVCGVIVFFTVAGYVCSYRPLLSITQQDHESLFKTLPASAFRRWFRLYLPVLCSTFLISMLAYSGFYEPTRFMFNPKLHDKYFPGPGTEPQPPRFPTLAKTVDNWTKAALRLANFWTEHPKDPPFDYHLWTIVYEYRSSMQLYAILLLLAKCKTWARILAMAGLGYIYAFKYAHYEMICFLYGAIIAQFDVLRNTKTQREDQHRQPQQQEINHQHELPRSRSPSPPRTSHIPYHSANFSLPTPISRPVKQTVRTLLFTLALYLMSFPIRGGKYPAPLYAHTINPLLPASYGKAIGPKFPKQVGVLLLLHLLTTVPAQTRARSLWHRLLTHPMSMYLGKIMFGFFLTHSVVMHGFGYAVPHLVWNHVTHGGASDGDALWKYLLGLAVGWSVSLVAALWLADVWTREVEGRCVRFTSWVEDVVFVGAKNKKSGAEKLPTSKGVD